MTDIVERLRDIRATHADASEAANEITALRAALDVAMREVAAQRSFVRSLGGAGCLYGISAATDANPLCAAAMERVRKESDA